MSNLKHINILLYSTVKNFCLDFFFECYSTVGTLPYYDAQRHLALCRNQVMSLFFPPHKKIWRQSKKM